MSRKPSPKSSAPPIRPRPEPGRYPFCKGVPLDALRQLVELALWKRGATGEPFTWEMAVVDYMVETDNGRAEVHTLEERAERWGWDVSKQAMSKRLQLVREDAADWAGLYAEKRAADREANRQSGRAENEADQVDGSLTQVDGSLTETPSEGPKTGGQVDAGLRQVDARLTGHSHIPARDRLQTTNLDDDDAGDRAREAGSDSESRDSDSVNSPPAAPSLHFIAEDKRAAYRPAIEDLLGRYTPQSLDMLVRNAWGRAATSTGITNVLAQLREQEALHGTAAAFERVTAAVVIANVADKPNELYTKRVLATFDARRADSDRQPVAAPEPDAGDEGGARGSLPAARRAPVDAGAAAGGHAGRTGGFQGAQRQSASDRRSSYGYDDARRDVRAALADFLPSEEHDGGRHDG